MANEPPVIALTSAVPFTSSNVDTVKFPELTSAIFIVPLVALIEEASLK